MRIFGRGRGGEHPVFAFWQWWAESGRAIDPSAVTAVHDELTRRVTAIDAGLTWHFGKGTRAEHRLTLSSDGAAESRPAAERWLRAAPSDDPRWEFRASQEADPDALRGELHIADRRLDLAEVRFGVDVDEDRLRVHVGTYHPAFAEMAQDVRGNVTFLVLDWLLGEDDVERWVGEVKPLTDAPAAPRTGEQLRGAVAGLAALRDPEQWVLGRGEDDRGNATTAMWRLGLRWIDAPTLDLHHVIAAQVGTQADEAAWDAVYALEDELITMLGTRGAVVAHTVAAGVFTMHAYTDGEDQNVSESVKDWARRHRLKLDSHADPGWRAVRQFTA